MYNLNSDIKFHDIKIIKTDSLTFNFEYRKYCEQNSCGNYNNNYSCPPICGTPIEMKQKVLQYKNALVLKTQITVDNLSDIENLSKLKKEHTMNSLKFINDFKENNYINKGLSIMAGPCNTCKECKIKNDKPCINEDLLFSCVSAYCIDITDLANKNNMEIFWDNNIVSFFSLFCFND